MARFGRVRSAPVLTRALPDGYIAPTSSAPVPSHLDSGIETASQSGDAAVRINLAPWLRLSAPIAPSAPTGPTGPTGPEGPEGPEVARRVYPATPFIVPVLPPPDRRVGALRVTPDARSVGRHCDAAAGAWTFGPFAADGLAIVAAAMPGLAPAIRGSLAGLTALGFALPAAIVATLGVRYAWEHDESLARMAWRGAAAFSGAALTAGIAHLPSLALGLALPTSPLVTSLQAAMLVLGTMAQILAYGMWGDRAVARLIEPRVLCTNPVQRFAPPATLWSHGEGARPLVLSPWVTLARAAEVPDLPPGAPEVTQLLVLFDQYLPSVLEGHLDVEAQLPDEEVQRRVWRQQLQLIVDVITNASVDGGNLFEAYRGLGATADDRSRNRAFLTKLYRHIVMQLGEATFNAELRSTLLVALAQAGEACAERFFSQGMDVYRAVQAQRNPVAQPQERRASDHFVERCIELASALRVQIFDELLSHARVSDVHVREVYKVAFAEALGLPSTRAYADQYRPDFVSLYDRRVANFLWEQFWTRYTPKAVVDQISARIAYPGDTANSIAGIPADETLRGSFLAAVAEHNSNLMRGADADVESRRAAFDDDSYQVDRENLIRVLVSMRVIDAVPADPSAVRPPLSYQFEG